MGLRLVEFGLFDLAWCGSVVVIGATVVVFVVVSIIVSSFSLIVVFTKLVTFNFTVRFNAFDALFMLPINFFFRKSSNLGFDVVVVPFVILLAVVATVVLF